MSDKDLFKIGDRLRFIGPEQPSTVDTDLPKIGDEFVVEEIQEYLHMKGWWGFIPVDGALVMSYRDNRARITAEEKQTHDFTSRALLWEKVG